MRARVNGRSIAGWLGVAMVLSLAATARAAYLENVPQTLHQPDGTVIHCLASGD